MAKKMRLSEPGELRGDCDDELLSDAECELRRACESAIAELLSDDEGGWEAKRGPMRKSERTHIPIGLCGKGIRLAVDGRGCHSLDTYLKLVDGQGGLDQPGAISAFLELAGNFRGGPSALKRFYATEPRIFTGEFVEPFWNALIEGEAELETFEMLDTLAGRPETLGGEPFEWAMVRRSGWPARRLAQFGIDPDCKEPPMADFAKRLLAFEIPRAEFAALEQTLLHDVRNADGTTERRLHLLGVSAENMRFALSFVAKKRSAGIPDQEGLSEEGGQSAISAALGRLWVALVRHRRYPELRAFTEVVFEWIPEIRSDPRFRRRLSSGLDGVEPLNGLAAMMIACSLDRLHHGGCPRPLMRREWRNLTAMGLAHLSADMEWALALEMK